jgi:hypothetical protein
MLSGYSSVHLEESKIRLKLDLASGIWHSVRPGSVAPSYGAVRSSSIVLVLVLVLVIDSWLPAPRKIEDDDEDDYEHDKGESRQAP